MSRNKKRTASAAPAVPAAVTTEPTTAAPATLSYVTPTEFVEIPSRGMFYPTNHPLHGKEVIEMRYMTAKDEDILTSTALLKKGLAIDRLIDNLIVDKSIRAETLLVGDKNAVILAARISGYGEDYQVETTCEACSATNDVVFNLSEIPHNHGYQPDENNETVSATQNGTFMATLPRTQFQAEFRLLTGEDENYLEQSATKLRKLRLPDATATNLLKKLVVSVNGDCAVRDCRLY